MKVAVFSTPRTSSSYTVSLVARKLNLENYNELYDETTTIEELPQLVETKLYNTDNYAIKFMSAYFTRKWLNFDELQWERFDYIVFTERVNVTDQLCSWYMMRMSNMDPELYTKLTGIDSSGRVITNESTENLQVDIDKDFIDVEVEGVVYMISRYHKYKNTLIEKFPDRSMVFTHEMFHKKPEEYLDELNSVSNLGFTIEDLYHKRKYLDYTQLFTNYEELQNKVNSFLGINR